MAPQQGYGTTGERKRISASHTETKQGTRPEEDHSQIAGARSNSWAECRDKKGSAPSRRTELSLDIPFYRTCPITAFYKGESQEKKHLRRLEGAGLFAALSSPCHVERLWGIRSS
jgi:hypothetical protein